MKKLLSLLGIVLILSTLMITFASCGVEYYVPADNVEDEEQEQTNKNFPKTEKEKNSLYISAMNSLKARDWSAAYNYFKQIPDYENVPEYLAGFSYQARTLVIRDITDDPNGEGTNLYNITTSISDYGYFHGEKLTDYVILAGGTKPTETNTSVQKIRVPAPTTQNPANMADEIHGRPASTQYQKHVFFGRTIQGYKVEYTYEGDSSRIKTESIIQLHSQNFVKTYTYNADKSIQKINITWARTIQWNYEFQYVYEDGKLMQIKFVDLSQGHDSTPRDYANYTYNAKGQLTSVTYPGGSLDPIEDMKVWSAPSYEWNSPVWNEENAYTITYTYNKDGLLATEVLDYKNSNDYDQSITYDEYNENGVLVQKTVTMMIPTTTDGEELQLKTFRYRYTQIKLCYDPLS